MNETHVGDVGNQDDEQKLLNGERHMLRNTANVLPQALEGGRNGNSVTLSKPRGEREWGEGGMTLSHTGEQLGLVKSSQQWRLYKTPLALGYAQSNYDKSEMGVQSLRAHRGFLHFQALPLACNTIASLPVPASNKKAV